MKKLTTLPCGNKQDDFTKRALPFQKRFYRTALILTKSPHGAEQLLLRTSSYAKEKYCQFNPHTKLWRLAISAFTRRASSETHKQK